MLYLSDDEPAFGVHGLSYPPPTCELLIVNKTGLVDEPLPGVPWVSGLGDQQAKGRALAVMLDHHVVGNTSPVRTGTRQRRHDKPVRQLKGT
jgi:hypothetical protein